MEDLRRREQANCDQSLIDWIKPGLKPTDSVSRTNLKSLPLQPLLRIMSCLSAYESVLFTSLCTQFSQLRVPVAHLDTWGIRPSYSLHSDFHSFSRRDLLDSMRKTKLSSLFRGHLHFDMAIGPLTNVLAWKHVGQRVVLFSHSAGRLVIWEMVDTRQVVFKSFDCSDTVFEVTAIPGKLGIVSESGVTVELLAWEKLIATDSASLNFFTSEKVASGSMIFFEAHSLIAAILNGWVYVFNQQLVPLRSFRDTNWMVMQGRIIQADASLPYYWLVALNKALVYDVRSEHKKPVFTIDLPLLYVTKVESVLVSSGGKLRCYLILLQIGIESYRGHLYANSRLLSQNISDFSVCRDVLVAYNEYSSTVHLFQISASGVHAVKTIPIGETLRNTKIISEEQRFILIGQADNSSNECTLKYFDYEGWKFYQYYVNGLTVEKAAGMDSKTLLLGKSINESLPLVVMADYWMTSEKKLKIRGVVKNFVARTQKTDTEKKTEKSEKHYIWRREQKRQEKKTKREKEVAMESKHWKSSLKISKWMSDIMLEDFSLLE